MITKVDAENRNFTTTPDNKFFIQINGTVGAQFNQYSASIKFRYYKFKSGCPRFTKWDGDKCVADYFAYCASLTPDYIRNSGNPEAFVYFNGTSCVLSKGKKDEEKEGEGSGGEGEKTDGGTDG